MEEDKKLEKRKNIEIVVLSIIIVALLGALIYLLFIKKDKPIDNNDGNNQPANNNQVVENKNADIYGTYYNSDYKDEYFKIDNDNTLVIVTSTCSDGMFPPKTVSYKITRENDKVKLAIDINNNQKYEDTYTGYKNNGVYRFKPDTMGCTTDEYTYFITENDKVVGINADIYGTYYNSDYKDEYFKIDNDRTLVIVTSTCSEGMFPPKTVSYKVTRENDKISLAIDINEDGTYLDTYTGSKNNGVYRFKPDTTGCTTDEKTYFVKK